MILFYSNSCRHCNVLLETIKKHDTKKTIKLVVIDSIVNKVSHKIKAVPALMFIDTKEIIYGKINVNDSNFEYNRLCAGTYVGYCNKIIELFENSCELYKYNNEDDDQQKLSNCYSKCSNCLQLDYNNELFYCVESNGGLIEYVNLIQKKQPYMEIDNEFYFIQDNRLVLKKNNSKPVFIQGNGNLNMDILATKLNLPLKITHNRNFFEYSTKKFIFNILKLLLGYIIITFHVVLNLMMYILCYTTTNIYILLAIIIINVFILTQWFLLGNCILNSIENILLSNDDSTYEMKEKESMFVSFLGKYFGERNVYVFFSLIPLIISTYSTFKIIHILKKKIPFKFIL
jgi:hypothetical protein